MQVTSLEWVSVVVRMNGTCTNRQEIVSTTGLPYGPCGMAVDTEVVWKLPMELQSMCNGHTTSFTEPSMYTGMQNSPTLQHAVEAYFSILFL